jgi:hypothetical protein
MIFLDPSLERPFIRPFFGRVEEKLMTILRTGR